jgi:hypothetical protein
LRAEAWHEIALASAQRRFDCSMIIRLAEQTSSALWI